MNITQIKSGFKRIMKKSIKIWCNKAEEIIHQLKKIRNKKIKQTIIKIELEFNFFEQTLIGRDQSVRCLVKVNSSLI